MSRDIKAICQIKKQGELYNLIVVVFATCLSLFVYFVSGEDDTFKHISNLIASFAVGSYLMMNAFFKVFLIADEGPKAVSFGMTRRKLFIYSRIVDILELIIMMSISLIFIDALDQSAIIKLAAIVFGAMMFIEGIAGNNVIKYGKIVFWIYYVCYFLVMIGIPRLAHNVPSARDFMVKTVDYVFNPFFNQLYVWIGIVAFCLIGIFINWLTFRKMAVRQID